jgi:superfamily II DNA or RNA helicase
VLGDAHAQLLALRRHHPEAGGLVIAMDQEHAQGIAELLRRRFAVTATVAVSDDPLASMKIGRFAASSDPWIVAVRMVSEGVDIPRLRVGVFATTTTTELFFRQAVGRLVRWTRGVKGQKSFLYIPDEPRLRARAFAIAEQRRHSLRHEDRVTREVEVDDDGAEQDLFSGLFEPISAVPLGDGSDPDWLLDDDSAFEPLVAFDDTPELTIPLPPLPGGRAMAAAPGGRTLREHKEFLREANATRTRSIARHTGQTHAAVNAELNRVSGVKKVSEATVEQLEKRLQKADAWLRQASARRVAG